MQIKVTFFRLLSTLFFAMLFAASVLILIAMNGWEYLWDSNIFLVFSEMFSNGIMDREASYAPLTIWSLGGLKAMVGDTATTINVYFFAIWLAFFLTVRAATSTAIFAKIFAFVFIFTNPATLKVFSQVLSEPGYGVLLSIAVLGVLRIMSRGVGAQKQGLDGVEIAFLIALALLPIQRYAGAFAAVPLGLAYLISAGGWRKIGMRFSRLIPCMVPTLFVVFWNVSSTGHLSGYRDPSVTEFAQNWADLINAIMSDYAMEATVFLLSALLLVGFELTRAHKSWQRLVALVFIMSAPILQLVAQVYTNSVFDLDPIGPRFIAVFVPTIVVVFVVAISRALLHGDTPRPAALRDAVLVAAAALIIVFSPRLDIAFTQNISGGEVFPETQTMLAQMQVGKVVVVEGNTKHLFAEDILLNRLYGPPECRKYTTEGSFYDPGFHFTSRCGADGITFHPGGFTQWGDYVGSFDALILAPWSVPPEQTEAMQNDAPECVISATKDGFLVFDLRPCAVAN